MRSSLLVQALTSYNTIALPRAVRTIAPLASIEQYMSLHARCGPGSPLQSVSPSSPHASLSNILDNWTSRFHETISSSYDLLHPRLAPPTTSSTHDLLRSRLSRATTMLKTMPAPANVQPALDVLSTPSDGEPSLRFGCVRPLSRTRTS
jgi:hypothetical protein